jgi:hypothetical protein
LLIAWVAVIVGLVAGPLTASAATGQWSKPVLVDPVQSGDGPNANILDAVSCASPWFCVAVDGSGYVTSWNGRRWTKPLQVDHSGSALTSVSCPSASFCVAVDGNGYETTFDGETWSRPQDIDSQLYFFSVSCPTASFCMAVGNFAPGPNQVVVFNGQSWSAPQSIDNNPPDNVVGGVSCLSASLCEVVDAYGRALTFNNGAWAGPVTIDSNHALDSVSCASPSFCAAMGNPSFSYTGSEDAVTFDGTAWSAPTAIDSGTARNQTCTNSFVSPCEGLSCSTASFCMAVDDLNHAITWNGRSWSAPTTLDSPKRLIMAVACAALFCVATDSGGYVTEYGLPTLSDLHLSPKSFRAGPGTVVSYRDSVPAVTTIALFAERRGVVRRGKCVSVAHNSTQRAGVRRCSRFVRIGSISRQDTAGRNQFDFSGRLHGQKLLAGHYLLKASASYDHLTGQAISATFVITPA